MDCVHAVSCASLRQLWRMNLGEEAAWTKKWTKISAAEFQERIGFIRMSGYRRIRTSLTSLFNSTRSNPNRMDGTRGQWSGFPKGNVNSVAFVWTLPPSLPTNTAGVSCQRQAWVGYNRSLARHVRASTTGMRLQMRLPTSMHGRQGEFKQ